MKARDAFGVVVRAAGFGFLLAGFLDLLYLAAEVLGLPVREGYPPERVLTAAGIWALLGLAVLACASRIVSLIYGRDNSG
jgi:hypothetical protein